MFADALSLLCSRHREETLSFLTVKTAAVRCGAKPGELLRVPLCGRGGQDGCAKMRVVFAQLGLPYRILSEDGTGALALFYHPAKLAEALRSPEVVRSLSALGYPVDGGLFAILGHLAGRWAKGPAHEVGFFIGYPAKDVLGFRSGAREVTQRGDRWRVFGEVGESRRLMRLHRAVELRAVGVCLRESSPTERFRRIAGFASAARVTQKKGA